MLYLEFTTDIIKLTLPTLSSYGAINSTCKSFQKLHGGPAEWKKHYQYICEFGNKDYKWKGLRNAIHDVMNYNISLYRSFRFNIIMVEKCNGGVNIILNDRTCRFINDRTCRFLNDDNWYFSYIEYLHNGVKIRMSGSDHHIMLCNRHDLGTIMIDNITYILRYVLHKQHISYNVIYITDLANKNYIFYCSGSVVSIVKKTVLYLSRFDPKYTKKVLSDLIESKINMNYELSSDFWLCADIYEELINTYPLIFFN